jgi:hypothetical protein
MGSSLAKPTWKGRHGKAEKARILGGRKVHEIGLHYSLCTLILGTTSQSRSKEFTELHISPWSDARSSHTTHSTIRRESYKQMVNKVT